jgi:hypothetical protein
VLENKKKKTKTRYIDMTSKSKIKGSTFERVVVDLFRMKEIEAKRAWGSNGASLGMHEEVDVLVKLPNGQFDRSVPPNPYYDDFKIQCKRRKKIPKFLGLTEHVDAVVFKEDHGKVYILMSLNDFIRRIER